MTEYLLPSSYVLCMIGFTMMRKIGLAKYLKPHQVSIAIAVGITVVTAILSYLQLLGERRLGDGSLDALLLFLQLAIFLFALKARDEIETNEMLLSQTAAAFICGLSAFNAEECDRYAVFVILCFSAVSLFVGFQTYREGSKARFGAFMFLIGIFGAIAASICESQPFTLLYAIVGLCALLLVKIAHPILGDKLEASLEEVGWRA